MPPANIRTKWKHAVKDLKIVCCQYAPSMKYDFAEKLEVSDLILLEKRLIAEVQ